VSKLLIWLALVVLGGMSACVAPAPVQEEMAASPMAAATLTPTETIVWFPPTPTRTPFPTQAVTPTPDPRPARGSELLVDDFTDNGHWPVSQSAAGSVAYGRSELTLAVRQSKASVSSLRDGPELGDFYLEITTKASLCRGGDMYGLLLRAASANNSYRFLINCNGELRVERILDGRSLPLQDWTQSGIVPAGSPVVLRIGVVASGRQMSIFINDLHQLDIDDRTFSSGRVGVYARSSGDSALSVSFSDLVVTELMPEVEE
jgi:hypothetical protein